MTRHFIGSRVLVLLVAAALIATPAHSDVRYVYDALGRLIAVIDTSGDTATYTYDAVGNILAIDRYTSTTVSVISFSPASGPSGTTVTISGTGFSSTPSQNSVAFNGTAAAVSAATTTQLVVTVPSGASTRSISVTAPAGSDSSSSSFTVAAAATPTITSFTPSVGVSGTSVTISGTNFLTTAASNRLLLNMTPAWPTSNSATSVATTVPAHAASGRIKITTPLGQAQSADDFFVPPTPYTAADVLTTARMAFSQATGVSLSTANKIGLVVFDGTFGDRVSLKIVCGPAGLVRIYNPDASTLVSQTGSTGTGLIEPVTLQRTGTYTVMVDPNTTGTGTTTLTAYDVQDVVGSIVAGGSAVTVAIDTPGQNGTLTFSGSATDRIALKSDGGAPLGNLTIKKPDGTSLASGSTGSSANFIDTEVLSATGTYSVLFDPLSANVGSGTFTLYDVPDDVTGSISFGSATNVPITTAGQNGQLTFTGTTGQRISLKSNSGSSVPLGEASVIEPDGGVVGSAATGALTGFMDVKTLSESGTYTVQVDPTKWFTGTVVLTLYDVPADLSGTLVVNDPATNVVVSAAGHNPTYTFTGTANQTITVRVTGNNMSVTVKLLKPDGTTLTSSGSVFSNFNLAQQTLPTGGTYSVVVDPSNHVTGSLNVAVTDP